MQHDKKFLETHNLPPIPKQVNGPKITGGVISKTASKYAQAGIVHTKKTNGGYSRTNYGGFFMH